MASKQAIANYVVAKAVAEATIASIQAMAAAVAERPQSMAGPKIGGPAMKQRKKHLIGRQMTNKAYSKPSG